MDLALFRTLVSVILIVFFLIVVLSGYVKALPDKVFIILSYRKTSEILAGRADVRISFLERLGVLYFGQMTVDIKAGQSVPMTDFINVNVDAAAKARIAPDSKGTEKTSRNFLNKKPERTAMNLQDSLQGNMRETVGTLTLKDINTNRDSLLDQAMMKVAADMERLGIETLSCNIQNVTDEKGLINDLDADNTSKIKEDVAIAKAQANHDVTTAQAEANKAINDARVLADTEIAQKSNKLAIRQSELKVTSDTKKAEADAAYGIQKQAQEKNIQIATVSVAIAKAERDSGPKKQEVTIMQQALDAEINKKADAEKYRVEQAVVAELAKRQREAEVRKYEQEREAEAKEAVAEAAKYIAEQKVSGICAKYEAEVSGIALRGKAEAEVRRVAGLAEVEVMEEKAETYQKYNNVAMAEMLIKVLPDITSEIVKPLVQINKITVIGGSDSNENGAFQLASNVPVVMGKLFESMKEATGIDLDEIMHADTYDAKVNRNLNMTGLGHANVSAEGAAEVPAAPVEKREAAPEAPAVEPRSMNDTSSTNKRSGRKAQ